MNIALISIIAELFTIVGVVAALAVYVANSKAQARQRSIDNAMRYWDAHSRLFEAGSYLTVVVQDMEAGTYKRDMADKALELKFNRFLGNIEHIALLQNAGGVPKSINAYMLGWFCKQIYPQITDAEKANRYWEIAVDFIEEIKKEAEQLDDFGKVQRLEYLRKNHFS